MVYNLVQSTQSLDLQWLANPGAELQLSDLSTLIDGQLPDFPDGFDLHLTKANAVLDLSSKAQSIEFTAVSGASASAFLLIGNLQNKWQLACGVALDTQISNVAVYRHQFSRSRSVNRCLRALPARK